MTDDASSGEMVTISVFSDAASLTDLKAFIVTFDGIESAEPTLLLANNEGGGAATMLEITGVLTIICNALLKYAKIKRKRYQRSPDGTEAFENYSAEELAKVIDAFGLKMTDIPPERPYGVIEGFARKPDPPKADPN